MPLWNPAAVPGEANPRESPHERAPVDGPAERFADGRRPPPAMPVMRVCSLAAPFGDWGLGHHGPHERPRVKTGPLSLVDPQNHEGYS